MGHFSMGAVTGNGAKIWILGATPGWQEVEVDPHFVHRCRAWWRRLRGLKTKRPTAWIYVVDLRSGVQQNGDENGDGN